MQTIKTLNGTMIEIDPLNMMICGSSNKDLKWCYIHNLVEEEKADSIIEIADITGKVIKTLKIRPQDGAMLNVCAAWALAEQKEKEKEKTSTFRMTM